MTPSFRTSLIVSAAWLLALASPAAHAATSSASPSEPLVILSTTDVKGKTSPCGCHIPKGGLARIAGFADSMRIEHRRLLLVDNGGFFAEDDAHQPQGAFLMDGMKLLATSAVGVGERDLRFGLAYLKGQEQRTGINLVCANLMERRTHKPVFAESSIQVVDGVRVGVFGLIGTDANLGPARDSLEVGDPARVAAATIKALKARGATAIVLLSQLGKVGSEDLVTAVDGIDAMVVGGITPSVESGRMIKNTLAIFGGDEGRYAGRIVLSLDTGGRVTAGKGELVALGPEISSNRAIADLVQHFEEDYNARQGAQPHAESTEMKADSLRATPAESPVSR